MHQEAFDLRQGIRIGLQADQDVDQQVARFPEIRVPFDDVLEQWLSALVLTGYADGRMIGGGNVGRRGGKAKSFLQRVQGPNVIALLPIDGAQVGPGLAPFLDVFARLLKMTRRLLKMTIAIG